MPARHKTARIALTGAIHEGVARLVKSREITEEFLTDPEALAGLRGELAEWAYQTYFAPESALTGKALSRRLAEIESKIILPILSEHIGRIYRVFAEKEPDLAVAPQAEFYALPLETQRVVAGSFKGWLAMSDGLAEGLVEEYRDNLLKFYARSPLGKMKEVQIFPGVAPAIVHEDLVPMLQRIAARILELSPLLSNRYPEFWKSRGSLGLQIRYIRNSPALSQHALGKAIDIGARENPHLKDPRLLTILSILTGINTREGLQSYRKRHQLLKHHRETLLAGNEFSEEFKQFLKILLANRRKGGVVNR